MSNVEIAEGLSSEPLDAYGAEEAESDARPDEAHPRPRSVVLLMAIFLLAFLSAGSLLIVLGHFGFNTPRALLFSDGGIGTISSATVSNPLVVNSGGVFKKVLANNALNPTSGEDYLVFVWFRLRKALQAGDYAGLVGKFEAQNKHRPGFAISLEGAPDGIRPRVYWSGAQGGGRWYSFASRHIRRRDWYVVAVSFSRDTFLSAYMMPAHKDDQSDKMFLGGHKIEPPVIASSSADLVVGAYGASQFRGEIGSFGVLKGSELKGRVGEILEAIQLSPDQIPAVISSSIIQLWASPEVDRGPRNATIIPGTPVKRVTASVERQPRRSKASPRAPVMKKQEKR